MATDLRSEIFRLRAEGRSFAKIATELGTNKSRVQRELGKTADQVSAGLEDGFAPDLRLGSSLPAGLRGDPELAGQLRQLEADKLELQRLDLQARRVEAARRLQLMENPGRDGGGAMVGVLLQELTRLREDQARVLSQVLQRAQPASAPPAPTLTEQLSQWRQIGETMQSFAPPKAPSSTADLEFKVAMERLNLEERRISKQLEVDADERRQRYEGQRARDEAVAKAIEQFAPVLGMAVQKWVDDQQPKPGWTPPTHQLSNGEPPVVVHQNEVVGNCPRCGRQLAMTPGGESDACPACGQALQVIEGVVRARGLPSPASPGGGFAS